ncbi:MAG: LPS-assembly protein [Alphaproteobacteria bacterium]|nr:LPS-assembly protein [Alphaproteobacteria bacterium]
MMAPPPGLSSGWRARMWGGALMALFGLACLTGCLVATPSFAQLLAFPPREKPIPRTAPSAGQEQMLVRAQEINYDYSNERVSAVGNVQLYYGASTLEADRVIYDQKTKRLHAEGNVRLTQPDGTVTNGEIMDLSDDFRDGFVDSLRADAPEQTRFAANRAERSGSNFTVFHSGVYTACEPCKDDPTKPPKWQVKAARIVHDQTEKMMYFESARLELAGVPFAYVPYFSAPDPTVKRKTGFLVPSYSTSSIYGFGVSVPYYLALAPDYDVTFTPMITSRQGPVLQGEWRQRLMDGSYMVRATGVFQLDKSVFPTTSDGYRDWRGSVESTGQFNLGPQWVWGWDGSVLSDKNFLYDYGLLNNLQAATLLKLVPDFVLSQAYIAGRGDRSYFEARAMYFYGLSSADVQGQLPIVHPVIDHDFVAKDPVLGGELEVRSNLTSLSRQTANFDPISTLAQASNACGLTTADTALINRSNCLLRGVPGEYDRLSSEMSWRRTIVDPLGELWTPFVMVRGDAANINVSDQPGVSNYIHVGQEDIGRVMPTAGLEYRYPLINVQPWGTQTIQPIAQLIFRPNETQVGAFPNEDAQSLIFDDSNLFKINKFSGWDRVEGGGRANVGVEYTAQFNRGGNVNVLFGQSYQLYGQNSFAMGGTTNTGIDTGLDTTRSDYVARASYQPNSTLTLTSRFRFGERDFTLQRTELEATANFGRWTTQVMYGDYAAQPEIGFLNRREGILGSARLKVTENWVLLGAAQYDLIARSIVQTQLGLGYIDDCLILALNYITSYAYSGSVSVNHTFMMQVTLRTLGGSTSSQSPTAAGTGVGLPGLH